jgi:hypothetical protein
MMEIILLCSNAIIMGGMFILTLYRAKIEKKAIDMQIRNAVAYEKIKYLKLALKREKEIIMNMSGEEFIEFLRSVCDENNS